MKKRSSRTKLSSLLALTLTTTTLAFQNCGPGFSQKELDLASTASPTTNGGEDAPPGNLPPSPQLPVPVPVGGILTDLTIESLSTSVQSQVPVTVGHIFNPGSLSRTDLVVGKTPSGALLPLQMDVKATHADGSVRHAILTVLVPSLAAKEKLKLSLMKATGTRANPVLKPMDMVQANFTAKVRVNLGGVLYSASAEDILRSGQAPSWISGSVASEWLLKAPLRTSAGVAHPHLTARFAVRGFPGQARGKVDVILENNWAYEPAPQNLTYDVEVWVGGKNVYTKTGLHHFHHARWKKTFWWGTEPQFIAKHNIAYLINSRAVPNYDLSLPMSESALASLNTRFVGESTEPMNAGLANPYMPSTGGRPDIGLLPSWAVSYLLSMDPRARKATLGMGDLAGSWSSHYRDQNTDQPISLYDYPYMTIVGHPGDTTNPLTKKQEFFPACGGDCKNKNSVDVSHQPNFSYLPYLLTGDHFYLEELQFYAMFDAFSSNPGYRKNIQGLLAPEQLRGQAWGLRTIAEAAYITPDQDRLKAHFMGIVDTNLDWYNSNYTNNPNANKLGIITNGYSIVYTGGTGTAPWQDDFFTQSIGHLSELGFSKAKPLLAWKAKFQIGRMVAPGYCWILAANYSLKVRDTEAGPFYQSLQEVYQKSLSEPLLSMTCNSAEMAANLNTKIGEMDGYASSTEGFPSNYQPALAYAVDSGFANGAKAWQIFITRSVKPPYQNSAQFNIVPRK